MKSKIGFTLSCKSFRSRLLRALHSQLQRKTFANQVSRVSLAHASHTLRMQAHSKSKDFGSLCNSYGFTLAEVLITLSILGVVAAISIPSIYQNYKEKIYVTQLKRAYSLISNAVDIALVVHRNDNWGSRTFQKYIAPNLSVKKDCTLKTNCLPDIIYTARYSREPNTGYCLPNRSGKLSENIVYTYSTKLILKNGIIVYTRDNISSCPAEGSCYDLYIDINGEKGPNKYNVDLFQFAIYKDKGLIPRDGNNGMGCNSYTAQVLREGKMTYLKEGKTW